MAVGISKIKIDEFSKIGPALSWLLLTAWVTASYILSYLGRDTNSAVTIALVSNSVFQQAIYAAYQAQLKNSRNTNGIGPDGLPYETAMDEPVVTHYKEGDGHE